MSVSRPHICSVGQLASRATSSRIMSHEPYHAGTEQQTGTDDDPERVLPHEPCLDLAQPRARTADR